MKKLKNNIENTIIIDKSKFITCAYRISSVEEANELISLKRKEHYNANHNCYAYMLGEDANIQKCSDDGEPSKTAGYPMIEVLKKQNITDILVITTRYFGGIKLGAGGLIRAYGSSVSECLLNADYVVNTQFFKYTLECSYSDHSTISDHLSNYHILSTDYSDKVDISILLLEDQTTIFTEEIKNLTKDRALVRFDSIEFHDV